MTPPAPRDQLDDAAAAIDEITKFVIRQLTPLQEVSATAASTLSTLARSGPYRLTELAENEGISQPSMTSLISRLQQQGFVRRGPDASDGRIVLVAITRAGHEMLDRRRKTRVAFLSSLLGELEPTQQQQLVLAAPALRGLTDPDAVPAALAAATHAVMEGSSTK